MARRRQSERVQYAFGYVVDMAEWKGKPKEARVRALHEFFESEGTREINGVHIIAKWRNPDNWNPAHANWKTTDDSGQSLVDFYRTFHGRNGALYAAHQTNIKEFEKLARTSENKRRKPKKSKARRRIVSKVVKRKDGKKFVRANRVAKRKVSKSVRGKPKGGKGKGKTR